jgi:hypothetical protein
MIKVKLTDLIDAIEFHSDMGESFINLKTGEICFISEEAINYVEDDEARSYPEWMEEGIKIAKHYQENPDGYLSLPTQYEVDEYRMMEDFAENLEDEKMAGQLLITLKGQGAFRRFKDSVILLGIEKDWYKFRDERYKQFAIEWSKENEIALEIENALTDQPN